MTNEQLAALARDGDKQAMLTLWENVRFLCLRIGKRYVRMYTQKFYDYDDFQQDIFLAMIDAVQAYDPQKGAVFTSFLSFHIMRRCRKTLSILDGREMVIPASLDVPIGESKNSSIADLIEDENAQIELEAIETQVYSEQVSSVLMDEVHSLPNNQGKYIADYYVHGLSHGQIAEKYGETVGRIATQKRAGLNTLRRNRSLRAIQQDTIDNIAYHSSFSSWENHGRSSSTERAALEL